MKLPTGMRAPLEVPSEPPRQFTLSEANRTLPLVKRIVQDIVDAYPPFRKRLERFQELANSPALPEVRGRIEALREEIDRDTERLNDLIRELHRIGCEFKGFDEGLVDFHCVYEDRVILLCWKLGEERIEWWHEVGAGFAGRQPITPDMKV